MYDSEVTASFVFSEGKTSKRQQGRSRNQKYFQDKRTDWEDERIERTFMEPKPRSSNRPTSDSFTKKPTMKSSATKARAQTYHWSEQQDARTSSPSNSNILASFPFHSSSFHKDNNDTCEMDNVYNYEIDQGNLNQYKYVPKESMSNQRNLSAGSSRETSPCDDNDEATFDRPPSRQRHAFPTHLVDHDFDDEDIERKSIEFKPSKRPPSRHKPRSSGPTSGLQSNFASSCEINEQSLEDTINRFRSRRNADLLQQSHDPRRDGFEAVDENAPLPFRIEVTNEDWKTPQATRHRRSRSRPRQPSPATAAVIATTTDELRKSLQSRAEDPMIFKSTPDRRRRGRATFSSSAKEDALEGNLYQPNAQWIPASLQVDAVPETNDPLVMSGNATDLQLDDFNFTGPPDASLTTSLGKDFLSLFAQS
ncbi:hypothetical protein THRCLA_20535 [Thraustotheca clavata]|uniref:Uncharacterized protein n=1 Tax=Thraustotheca clavata TaxID=74557 RepID=A0A1W0A6B2_9STRA|nr:hypothetical protein THRCLA_20535 [Thraustotheca clavata]